MIIMVFDTETTGIPTKNDPLDIATLHLQPYIVQLSYLLYDTELNDIVEVRDHIIKVKNIPEESIQFHGITDEISQAKGTDIYSVLNKFFYRLKHVDLLVAHNYSFDCRMVMIELLRGIHLDPKCGNKQKLLNEINLEYIQELDRTYCTLRRTITTCKLVTTNKYGGKYYKFPKLSELHEKLFGYVPTRLHNSLNDAIVTLRCYMQFEHEIDLKDCKIKKFEELSNQIL